MENKNRFKISRHEPFIVEGENGEHKIPHPEKFSIELMEELTKIDEDIPLADKVKIIKGLFLQVCPDLEKEDMSDYDWLHLMSKYDAYVSGE